MRTLIIILIAVVVGACQPEDVKLANQIKGTWQISKVVYTSNTNGKDSTVDYGAKGLITFEDYDHSRPSYLNYYLGDWSAYCKTTFTIDKNNGRLFINPLVSPYIDSDRIHVNFTGHSTIEPISDKALIFTTTAVLLKTDAPSLKTRLYLVKR